MEKAFSAQDSMESIDCMVTRSNSFRDSLIAKYGKLVESLVRRIIRTMAVPIELRDELRAAGYLGLVEAAERYEPSQGEFRTFAFLRVRGAIIDCLRRSSELPPPAYQVLRALEGVDSLRDDRATIEKLTHNTTTRKLKREQRLAHLFEYAAKSALVYRLSVLDTEQEMAEVTPAKNPEDVLLARENASLCLALVESLPPKEREVIELYYFKGRSFIEIAKRSKNYSKSWVSRLHLRALNLLRQRYYKAFWCDENK